MRRNVELSTHLGTSKLQRLDLTDTLGIEAFAGLPSLPLFFFPFFHSLGEAGFRVDESFSGVTHWLVLIESQLCEKSAEHYTGNPDRGRERV